MIDRGDLKSDMVFRDRHLQMNVEQIANTRKCKTWFNQFAMRKQLREPKTESSDVISEGKSLIKSLKTGFFGKFASKVGG